MDYKLVSKPGMTVSGKVTRTSAKDGENLQNIPQFWRQCHDDGTLQTLAETAQTSKNFNNGLLGICTDFAEDMSAFSYLIAAEGPPTDGMTTLDIPPADWAVFKATGSLPGSIQNLWADVWGKFFVDEPYKHGAGPDVEVYPEGDVQSPDYQCEVWVPVVKK